MAAATILPADFAKSAAKGSVLPTSKVGRYSLARGGLISKTVKYYKQPADLLSEKRMDGGAGCSVPTPLRSSNQIASTLSPILFATTRSA
jgi:hypothetical protein